MILAQSWVLEDSGFDSTAAVCLKLSLDDGTLVVVQDLVEALKHRKLVGGWKAIVHEKYVSVHQHNGLTLQVSIKQ